jgi:hypothetical protein
MDCQADTFDDEKIDAVRIRLTGHARAMAVLAEFRSADRVLAGWIAQARQPVSIDFQVTFCDGFVLCGCYQYRRRSRCKPSLSNYVRAVLDLSRYSVDS